MNDCTKQTGPPSAVVYDDIFKDHMTGPGHPESPLRLDAVVGALKGRRFRGRLSWLSPRKASRDDILACHSREYLDLVERETDAGLSMLSTGDTHICSATLEAAKYAAGAAPVAIDEIMEGKATNAFCPVRPPGHHACAERGMGFCVFNNIAIAAKYAIRRWGVKRVMILDWDVHHGNGTQDIFYYDPEVFFVSMHQWPWYPGSGSADETGAGDGAGTTLNIPLTAGTRGKEAVDIFRLRTVEVAEQFKPGLVLVSAGFDALTFDPLGGLEFCDRDFAALTYVCLQIADTYANGRMVSLLEGGYYMKGLARAADAHVRALIGDG